MKRQRSKEPADWCCYILLSLRDTTQTYTGKTKDFERRSRQHNGELAGDCRSTKRYRPWRTLILITGFLDNTTASQVEWALKNCRAPRCNGVTNRIRTLLKVFQQPRATKKAPLFAEMQVLTINVHASHAVFLHHAGLTEMPSIPHASFKFQQHADDEVNVAE